MTFPTEFEDKLALAIEKQEGLISLIGQDRLLTLGSYLVLTIMARPDKEGNRLIAYAIGEAQHDR